MARVNVGQVREQEAHFGLYRTSAGGDESIIVRRKVGDPTDYEHSYSRKLKTQRDNLALASQHYAHLSPSQKAITRHQFEVVEFQKSHGKTDTKLLAGRQLFISREMRSLATTGKQLVLPHEVCIILVDEGFHLLDGLLWLRYLKDGSWIDTQAEQLATASWLFSRVPRDQEAYRVYGEAPGFFDPLLPEAQHMSAEALLGYHYHHLHSGGIRHHWDVGTQLWGARHGFNSPITTNTIHVLIEAITQEYDGNMRVGFQSYETPFLEDTWLTYRDYALFSGYPDPKHISLTFDDTLLTAGGRYWFSYIFNPYSSIFGIFHADLYFMPVL